MINPADVKETRITLSLHPGYVLMVIGLPAVITAGKLAFLQILKT